jgi:hypothetical protein
MIDLGYALTDPAVLAGWERTHDVATADPGELLWSGFPGTLRIATGEGELAPDFDWVPLLHFARSLILIVDSLTDPGSSAGYAFTESTDQLRFDRARELVRISATFSDTVLTTTMPELSAAVRRFAQRLLDDLTTRYPGLLANPAAADLRTELAERS